MTLRRLFAVILVLVTLCLAAIIAVVVAVVDNERGGAIATERRHRSHELERDVDLVFDAPDPSLFPSGIVGDVTRSRQVLVNLLGNAAKLTGEPSFVADAEPTAHEVDPRLRVLVAEDSHVNQKVVLRLLERFGLRADVAGNGLEAVAAVDQKAYDVVLMDVQMPEMDGLEATRAICKRHPAGKRPRIIAMTANAMKGDRERCVDAGMDDYLSKPLRTEALHDALVACVARGGGPLPAVVEPGPDAAVATSVLDRLRVDTDADFVRELKAAFAVDAPRYFAQLRGALPADAEMLRRAAHTLKSNGATLGALGLAALCQQLEDRGEAGSLDGLASLVEATGTELDRVLAALAEPVS